MTDHLDRLIDALAGLAWSLWGELGASTWERQHQGWAIELEPLIAFTANVGTHDLRLKREAVDWCVTNAGHVSVSQLRHVVKAAPAQYEAAVADFGATVSQFTRRSWPGSDAGDAYDLQPSGKSRLRGLEEPSMLQLRLRAMFGVGARAEIVRCLLTSPPVGYTVAQIAEPIAYTRRQISADIEMLTSSGMIDRSVGSGPPRYSLTNDQALRTVVGAMPVAAPRWSAIFTVLVEMAAAIQAVTTEAFNRPDVEFARRVRLLDPTLEAAQLRVPRQLDESYDTRMARWATDFATGLSAGDMSVLPPRQRLGELGSHEAPRN